MEAVSMMALLASAIAFGVWRWSRRRAFAVRRYESTYSAIDAAVGRAARQVPQAASGGTDRRSHVHIVAAPPRRRSFEVVSGDAEITGERGGVSSTLAG